MAQRLLVMGDNHGDTESLRRVLDDTEGETFDFAIHVGDFTRAWRYEDRKLGAEQLRAVEPFLERLDERASHGLLWVYGNQEYFGDLPYDLDVGTEIPDDGCLDVGGQRFTSDPAEVESDVILITHMEKWSLIDHFDGKAHFCGNTHLGRHRGRRLNSSFLQASERDADTRTYGGYFVVEMGDSPGFEVEMRPIGNVERKECDRHRERGVQFLPSDWECMYCQDQRVLMREMAASAFYGVTAGTGRDAVTADELVEYAVELWDDPPSGLRRDFGRYLGDLEGDRYAPLARTDDGAIVVGEPSYAY